MMYSLAKEIKDMPQLKSGIYRITCIANTKIYIGSSQNIKHRLQIHIKTLSEGKHKNSHLQSAYNLYGNSFFIFEVIEFTIVDKLIEREQYWLDLTQSYNRKIGFNICINAKNSLGIKRSNEFKKKISLANLRRDEETKQRVIQAIKLANTGRKGWNKGIKMWETRPHPRGGLGKKYPKRVLTPQGYLNLCISNRRDRGEKHKELKSKIKSKTHYFISPNGEKIEIFNLSKYCKENNLNQGHMNQVSIGNEKSYKGWHKNTIRSIIYTS